MNIEQQKEYLQKELDRLEAIEKQQVAVDGYEGLLRLPSSHDLRLFYKYGELEMKTREAQERLELLKSDHYTKMCAYLSAIYPEPKGGMC